MGFLVLSFLLLALGFAVVFWFWRRERRTLKQKTSQAMGREVWNEIVEEREEALRKRRAFQEALEKAKQK